MKKLVFTLLIISLFCSISPALALDESYLSDEAMIQYQVELTTTILSDFSFIAKTRPMDSVALAKELATLRYIPDKEEELASFSETYKKGGGDCEDLVLYALARFYQQGTPYLGILAMISPKEKLGHIATLVHTGDNVQVIDLTTKEKVFDLVQYYIFMYNSGMSHCRAWWFYLSAPEQPDIIVECPTVERGGSIFLPQSNLISQR